MGGATLALGRAMRARGHDIAYFGFAEAFPRGEPFESRLRFPWRLSGHLRQRAREFDIVDASSGDAWVWLLHKRRPSLVVTRAHGLEHAAHEALMLRVRRGDAAVTWRYRFYTGGYRLWEVRRSIQHADGVVVLNDHDKRAVEDQMHVPDARVLLADNGVSEAFRSLPPPDETSSAVRPLGIVCIGSWIPRKGTSTVTAVAAALASRGVRFRLEILGSGVSEPHVLAAFDPELRPSVRVVRAYSPGDLPRLLAGAQLLLHASWSEGFSLALAEGMACGLAPIASTAGAAPRLVRDGETGLLIRSDDPRTFADAIVRLESDRRTMHRLRLGAYAAVQSLTWPRIAEDLELFYLRLDGMRRNPP